MGYICRFYSVQKIGELVFNEFAISAHHNLFVIEKGEVLVDSFSRQLSNHEKRLRPRKSPFKLWSKPFVCILNMVLK